MEVKVATPNFMPWIIWGLVGLGGAGALWGAHVAYSSHYREEGRKACQELHDKQKAEAIDVQAGQNTQATTDHTKVKVETETIYVNRIKEIVRYVPNPSAGPCLADPDFVRLYNDPQGRADRPNDKR